MKIGSGVPELEDNE